MKMKQNRKYGMRVSIVILLAMVLLLLMSLVASAKNDDVTPADELEVWVQDGDVSAKLATYTLDDLEDIGLKEEVYYASIDNFPTTVLTIATGIALDDLIADIEKNYAQQIQDWGKLRISSTDGWKRTYTSSALAALSQDRYYYPALFNEGIIDEGEITDAEGAASGGVKVPAMLAVYSYQARVPDDVSFDDAVNNYVDVVLNEDNTGRFRLCMGMTADELSNSIRITSDLGKGICKLEFIIVRPELSNISITKEEEDIEVTAKLSVAAKDGWQVMAAAYDNGKMTVIDVKTVTMGSTTVSLSLQGAIGDEKIKLFLLDKEYCPIAESATKDI